LRGQSTKPGQDGLRTHDLAAGQTLVGGQRLTLPRQPIPLLVAQIDPRLPGRYKDLLQNPDLLLQVVDPPYHPLVDGVRDRRDDELKRHRQHRIAPRLPAHSHIFKPAVRPIFVRELAATSFWTLRVRCAGR
jgi:hypothetical protein